jgi:pyruvate/2-oxoglutarate dehydrogenase complex dihydrolipoamide dehydrogenase (E3) component
MTPLTPVDEHNQLLLDNAHPLHWKNPVAAGTSANYNLVVLGAGTAGLVAAAGAAGLGARVALIERDLMGGDCLNYGCVPSKALLRSARAAYDVGTSDKFGVHLTSSPRIEFGEAMARLRRLRSQISFHDSAQRFAGLGVEVFFGAARFVAKNVVEVDGAHLTFQKAILATGARPATLAVPGLAETGFLTNETVFSLMRLPASLAVIGAGPVGCELAQAFRRFGAEVSVVSLDGRLLPRDDPDASVLLAQQFECEGIRMFLGAQIRRVARAGAGKAIVFERGNGVEQIAAEEILLAVGRTPNIDGLELEAAGIRYTDHGVVVDDGLRTSNARVYAAGDVCSSYKFTHAAEATARVALQNALFFRRKKASKLVIPWCTYTDPEVAHVGITFREAAQRGPEIETATLNFADNDRATVDGDTEGFLRIHSQKRSGRILGATVVGRHAGEIIGELVLAIGKKMRVADLSALIHPYPTQADIITRAGDSAFRERLKPWMKNLLIRYFNARR